MGAYFLNLTYWQFMIKREPISHAPATISLFTSITNFLKLTIYFGEKKHSSLVIIYYLKKIPMTILANS